MKITSAQLRSIIAEEMARATRRRLTETVEDVSGAASEFVDLCARSWSGSYEADDPVMSADGPEAWAAQVDAAREELNERLEEIVRDVEDKLFGGAYA